MNLFINGNAGSLKVIFRLRKIFGTVFRIYLLKQLINADHLSQQLILKTGMQSNKFFNGLVVIGFLGKA